MRFFEELTTWYRWGFWFDTPQGVLVLLSVPICWVAALAAAFMSGESCPGFLQSGAGAFLVTPVFAFLYFLRFGQRQRRSYSSSWLTTGVVFFVILVPFVLPYFRSH